MADPGSGPPHADDLAAVRLQRRIPWVLPLPDQAVVREQALMVLPAHGPWLPDNARPLMRQDLKLRPKQFWYMHRWQEHVVLACLPHLLVHGPTLREAVKSVARSYLH